MSAYMNVPDLAERKGSLFLRSDHMNYSRATLNSNWHQAREAEPKDYDISKHPQRDLCNATYQRIGNVTNGTLPQTTYQNFSEQIYLKKDFEEKDAIKPVVNADTVANMDMDRDTGTPQRGYGAVLAHHNPDHDKHHLDTTHRSDYKPPYPYTPAEEKPQEFADHSLAYKRCQSQFTDTADCRRSGRNTWQDETGVYSNSAHKRECPTYKRFDPVLKEFID